MWFFAVSVSAGKVAFMHTDTKTGCVPLAVYSVADGVSKTMVNDKNVRETCFSPNGKWIYCAAADCDDTLTDIYRVRSGGGVLYPVVIWNNSVENGLAFSPKLREMAFCSNRDGSWQIYLTDLDGIRPLRLTDDDDNHVKPLFSPNEKYISYLSNHLNTDGCLDLWIYDRARANHVRITDKMRIYDYCWLDKSRKILVSAGLDFPELKVVDIRTGAVSKFLAAPPQNEDAPYGERNPRVVTFNGKKRVVYIRDFGDEEYYLYWTAIDGSDDKIIVDKE
jgi:WD40 repeat protein